MKSRHNYLIKGPVIALFFLIIWWIITIKQGNIPYVDQWTRSFVTILADTPVYTLFRYVTELGSKSFVLPLTIIMTMIIWVVYKKIRPAFIFGFGVLGTHLLNKSIKGMVARERPSVSAVLNAEGFSFPSGHSMVSLVCYGLLAFFICEKIQSARIRIIVYISFAWLILMIGMSRYVINVHYLTDILTGYTFGTVILMFLISLYKRQQIIIKKTT